MKKILILFLFVSISITTSFAQFGIRATYGKVTASGWEEAIQDNLGQSDVNFNNIGVGVDYWFRLKNQRIEFMPTLNYMTAHAKVPVQVDGSTRGFDVRSVGLHLNTHIYFLDFKGDCDCPTWSKNEPWVEKGLFAFVSPGVDYQLFDYLIMDDDSSASFKRETNLNFNLGVGLGLDIGLSDLITLTPYAGIRLYQPIEWNGFLSDFELPQNVVSNMHRLYGGFRLGVRLDD